MRAWEERERTRERDSLFLILGLMYSPSFMNSVLTLPGLAQSFGWDLVIYAYNQQPRSASVPKRERERARTDLMEDWHPELLKSESDVLAERPPVSLFSRNSTASFRSVRSLGVEVDGVDRVPAGKEEENERRGRKGNEVSSSVSLSLVSAFLSSRFWRLTSCKELRLLLFEWKDLV